MTIKFNSTINNNEIGRNSIIYMWKKLISVVFLRHFEKSYIDLDLFIYHWIFLEAYPEFSDANCETLNSNKLNAAA